MGNLMNGMRRAYQTFDSDVTVIHRPMLSRLSTFERFTKGPRVFDVDDAIWLQNPRMAASLARLSQTCICGNRYLADWFGQFAPRVVVLPTGIDTSVYEPATTPPDKDVIGWIGSRSTLPELEKLESVFDEFFRRHSGARLRVVCNERPRFSGLVASHVDFVEWRPGCEPEEIRKFAVGIMPLDDTEWNRGKCSFKLIQYMGCGVPIVASPVGMNVELFATSSPGILAETGSDWIQALSRLFSDSQFRRAAAGEGRSLVMSNYSVEALADRFSRVLFDAARLNPKSRSGNRSKGWLSS
ncbi:glycosyltransferase family 4 protein [bacterium]|nr:glycosyltransferase family 4 protein [bacterium]